MKRGKKIALIVLLVVIALVGTIGGVALAQSGDDENNQAETTYGQFMERVCAIYQEKTGVAIDPQTLRDSLTQAGDEKKEQIRNQFRQRLIDEGVFTEEELTELEDWWGAKPDIATEFPRFQNRVMHRFSHGFGGGFGGWCINGNSGE